MEQTINDRIRLIINELYGGSASKLAQASTVSRSTINSVINGGKSSPSVNIVSAIYLSTIPKLSADWLLTGRGEMLAQPAATTERAGRDINHAGRDIITDAAARIAVLEAQLSEARKWEKAYTDLVSKMIPAANQRP